MSAAILLKTEINNLLTVKELARYLQIDSQTIYKWVRTNQIPHKKIGHEKNSAVRFELDDVMAWTSTECKSNTGTTK